MAFEKFYYLKYPLNYSYLIEYLRKNKKEKLNIFIDLNSICRGFYKAETILFEVGEYGIKNEVSGQLIKELRLFLNHLWSVFKEFDPFFIIFYDDGQCIQNTALMSTYKSERKSRAILAEGEDQKLQDIFRIIRKFYYSKIREVFTKDDISFVFYSHEYETDLVPYYCLRHDFYDSAQSDVMNFVLSVDKDLLQTCQFPNVLQLITRFKPNKEKGRYEIDFGIFDNQNAVSYIYPKFKDGSLTAKYIPMILSLCGDRSDDILGLSGIGEAKAVKLILDNHIPWTIDGLRKDIKIMPQIIQDNIDIIIRNFKIISFEEQIKRLPREFMGS